MSAGKHTPGPWEARRFADTTNVWAVGRKGAAVAYDVLTPADAILIAAAPDLLEALLNCVAAIERTAHCTEADRLAAAKHARAAIAKAGGQS